MIIFFSTEFFQVRPDLCATDCPKGPRSFLGKFWTDSLVHDDNAIKLLVDVIGKVSLTQFFSKMLLITLNYFQILILILIFFFF